MTIETHASNAINFKSRKIAAIISLIASLIVLSLKSLAYYKTNSAAVLSDALESIVNVITAITALFVVNYVSQPADEEHPYGHGKAEYFSAAFEGGLIFFAAVMIIYEGILALIRGVVIKEIHDGLFIIGLATAFNFVLGLYLKKIGKREKSETLLASGVHVLSDVKTTIGVIIALIIVHFYPNISWIDPALAIGVALQLAWDGFAIVKRSIGALIDEKDLDSIKKLSQIFLKYRTSTIIDIHHLRAIRSGSFHHIDAHVVVPGFMNITDVHDMVQNFEKQVVQDYHYDGEIAFHLDPCKQNFCKKCEINNCSIRKEEFVKLYSFLPEEMIKGPSYS